VPPDLTTFLAAKALKDAGESLVRFDGFYGGDGFMPSGTIETVFEGVEAGKGACLSAISCGLLGAKTRKQKAFAPKEEGGGSPPKPRSSKTYVPKEASKFRSNLVWSMIPGYSRLGRTFCLPHFMAPININVVHRTACAEGYPGLVYRERLGSAAKGFVPMCGGILCGIALGLFLPFPYSTSLLRRLLNRVNPALIKKARTCMFAGYAPTGSTVGDGVGISASGRLAAKVKMSCEYDPGLGFTMLSACVVASSIVKRQEAKDQARIGFQTAVTALGGEALADGLRAADVAITVTTEQA